MLASVGHDPLAYLAADAADATVLEVVAEKAAEIQEVRMQNAVAKAHGGGKGR